jgi:hypothetical protein
LTSTAFNLLAISLISAAIATGLDAQESLPIKLSIRDEEIARPPNLPAIGKWMIDRDGTVAHWLGEIYQGKRLHEPINVILVVAGAQSAGDALELLLTACAAAGYPARFGHSTGYRGYIGGTLYDQMPRGRDDAFSDHLFERTNNHGRIFGPRQFGGSHVFIGAFSREEVDLLRWPGHRFASFNQARDDFARNLNRSTRFKAAGFVVLDNAITGNPQVTTADHDGRAVLLEVTR